MSMKKHIVILMAGLLLIPVSSYAVSVRATVDRNRITQEDILNLKVSVTDSEAQVDTSAIKDFRILSQSSGTSFQWINGKTLRENTYSYSLSPLRQGQLTIPALTVKDNGKTYATQPITILVQESAAGTDQDSRDIFVEAKINDALPYVGEQIIYEFSLYAAARITNANLNIPDFNDFVVKELDKDTNFTTVMNGREYQGIHRRVVLIPLKPGTYNIPPSVLNCDKVIQGRGRGSDPFDLFSDPFFGRSKLERKILRTKPMTIQVNALPQNPFAVPFSGLVGKFQFTAKIENTNLKVGDSTTLTMTVSGSGNLMDAADPTVQAPDGFKTYKDNPEENISLTADGYQGKKVFRTALVAVKEGTYTLPPVSINVFHVETGQYEVLSSPAFELTVGPSDHADQATRSDTSGLDTPTRPLQLKKKVEYTGHDILPIKESLDGAKNKPGLSVQWFTLFLMLPVVMALVLKVGLTVMGRGKSRGALMVKRAEDAIKEAGKSGISDEVFLSNLYKAYTSIVFAKASKQGETLTTDEVDAILSKAGVDKAGVDEAKTLLDTIESIRFSGQGIDDASKKDLMEKTRGMIRRLRS